MAPRNLAFLGINHTFSYLMDPKMGAPLGLSEGDPEQIILALSNLSREMTNWVNARLPTGSLTFQPAVQYGKESSFILDGHDPELLNKIHAQMLTPHLQPVTPLIHAYGAETPLQPNFARDFRKMAELALTFQSPYIVVHLPIAHEDQMDETLEACVNPKVLDVLESTGVRMALENNHHSSFFGFLENDAEFLARIPEELAKIGREDLSPYFCFCYDHGHYVSQAFHNNLDKFAELPRFLKEWRDQILVLHLHNNDGAWDHHLFLGERPPPDREYHGAPLDPERLEENERLLLEVMPLFKDPAPVPRMFMTEKDHPYTRDDIFRHFKLLASGLAGREIK